MTDTRPPQPPLRARLASGYLTVLQRHARRDPEGVRVIHEYVDHLRSELRAARQALAERDDPSLADDAAPADQSWATRAAVLLEQERQQRARTWLPRPTPRPSSDGFGR